jgi:MoxR-like ATPase
MTSNTREKFARIRGALNATFIDRGRVIDGLLLALVTRLHILLMGPPGTAKSALAAAITSNIAGGKCFTVLLTRTTTPDEIFGPVDLVAFDKGSFERRWENFLPCADVAFLDEIWRGSSAILNGLLAAINERKVEFNGTRKDIPLRSVVAATNSLPESDDLHALDDRFALRYVVGNLDRHSDRLRLLKARGTPSLPDKFKLTLAELDAAEAEVRAVTIPDAVLNIMTTIWQSFSEAGHYVSERRWRSILSLMQARAWLEGRAEVNSEDLEVIADSVWRKPSDRASILAIVYKHSCPSVSKAVEMLDVSLAALMAIPARAPGNDIKVATAASDAKNKIKTILTDLESVIAKSESHEANRLAEYKAKIEAVRADVTRTLGDVIAA